MSSSASMRTRLTPRQLEAAGLVAQGYSNEEIAERLFISEQAVKNLIHRAYLAMGYSGGQCVKRVKLTLDYWRSYEP